MFAIPPRTALFSAYIVLEQTQKHYSGQYRPHVDPYQLVSDGTMIKVREKKGLRSCLDMGVYRSKLNRTVPNYYGTSMVPNTEMEDLASSMVIARYKGFL